MSSLFPARVHLIFGMLRRNISPMMLFSGVAVLGYAGFQYGAMFFEQRRLQALWREQQTISVHFTRNNPVVFPIANLTQISIPSIQLLAILVEGTDLSSLMIGPGHLTGTAQPGEAGNAVVSAHRDTFFRNITKLRAGDHIFIERNGQSFTYSVEEFRIVKPTDISVTAATRDSRLTLVTCDPAYYIGPAPQRLVVISKLVSAAPVESIKGAELSKKLPLRLHVKEAAVKEPVSNHAAK